ncbi:MAG: hypothetical protein V2A54_00695 [Bacteroidota bacterium]
MKTIILTSIFLTSMAFTAKSSNSKMNSFEKGNNVILINDSTLTSEMVTDEDTYFFSGVRPVNVMSTQELLLDKNVTNPKFISTPSSGIYTQVCGRHKNAKKESEK